jgi:sulfofructose kinase
LFGACNYSGVVFAALFDRGVDGRLRKGMTLIILKKAVREERCVLMGFDIVGVGHVCCDFLGIIPYYPEVDRSVWMNRLEKQGGGAVSQALVTASRLGATAAYVGFLGNDDAGEFLRNEFIKEKVDISCLKIETQQRSSVAFIVIEKETGKRNIFSYPGTVSYHEFDSKAQCLIASAKYLHLDATNYDAAFTAAQIAEANKVKISLDGCEIAKEKEQTLKLIQITDILIANAIYPQEVTGIDNRGKALLELAKMGPEIVICTIGEKGCLAVIDKKIVPFETYSVPVVDTTGAGDVFHGAFLFGLLQQWSIDYTIKFASATSAINCLSLGGRVGIPTKDKVLQFIRTGIA